MSSSEGFAEFLPRFFSIFAGKSFRGGDYLQYLERRSNEYRSSDEASIVDNAIVGPLLSLLGFAPAEQVYNQQRPNGRPDYAPIDSVYGTCFIVEDKNTSLDLTFDLANPDSHLSQLIGYMRTLGVYLGWLTNGRQLTAWRLNGQNNPERIIDLDIIAAIQEWRGNNPPALSATTEKALNDVFDLFNKASFSDPQRLEHELAIDLEEWQRKALSLGTGEGHETVLVETLQALVMELQRDARRILDHHLERYAEYDDKMKRLPDDPSGFAEIQLAELRDKVMFVFNNTFKPMLQLEAEDLNAIENILIRLERDVTAFTRPGDVFTAVLDILNAARQRKDEKKAKKTPQLINLDGVPILSAYCEKVFGWHQHCAVLRYDYRIDRTVHEDYVAWVSLVKETSLGGLNEDQQHSEFALQAAYVVFIRLLLIRVCEDKGVFPHRFISDGGIKRWQEDIERYFVFVQGNPYDHLLDIAYENAQNIYAHFFTGRELFNWYRLDRQHFVMALHRLSRFDFAGVDSDIIGTIYNTYVNRKEKRDKGQYYTPPQIIHYILDTVGYNGNNIIGSNKRLIDPACGSGSFLVAAAKRLVSAYRRLAESDPATLLERIKNNLFGFDLNPFACYLAEVNLLIQVLDLVKLAYDKKQQPKIERFHIYNVDALTPPTGMFYYSYFNTLLAAENDQVDLIKSRRPESPYARGFAFVVANPPYGATLSDDYKNMLRANWADVFYGQPDTYTFFLKFGVDLLASNGKLGFITPNTYLKGTNTANLRNKLLATTCVEQIVDLPGGIWRDANVDCVLLFLTAEADEAKRRVQQVQIYLLGQQDSLDKLVSKTWGETLIQQQGRWMSSERSEIIIRFTPLLQKIEDVCRIRVNGGPTKVLRLGDITESTQGIIPYLSREAGQANAYIKPRREVPVNEADWKPLLDGSAFVGRYELRWGIVQPYLKYGKGLARSRESKFFESPKLLVQDMRNRALRRRLVATFDDQKFYNRHNFSNIIANDVKYNLKYILALFNSSLLNYWFSRQYDNLHINPSYFRQLPIYPADPDTQAVFVSLVDKLLAKHAELNQLREQGYVIRQRRDGTFLIEVPYDGLLGELQVADHNFPTYEFVDAQEIGLFTIPENCDLQATISSNVYVPEKYPNSLVLRHNRLWLEVPDNALRRYLYHYLRSPRWRGKSWDDLKRSAFLPEDADALDAVFAAEARKKEYIVSLLDEIRQIDAEVDEKVLDLYGITDQASRQLILGNAPLDEDEVEEGDSTDVVPDGEL